MATEVEITNNTGRPVKLWFVCLDWEHYIVAPTAEAAIRKAKRIEAR